METQKLNIEDFASIETDHQRMLLLGQRLFVEDKLLIKSLVTMVKEQKQFKDQLMKIVQMSSVKVAC